VIEVQIIPADGNELGEEAKLARECVEASVRFAAVMLEEYRSPGLVIYAMLTSIAWVSRFKRPVGMSDEEAINDIVQGIRRVFQNVEMRDVTANYHSEGGKA